MATTIPFADLLAAVERELDLLPEDDHVEVGPARIDRARSDAFVTALEVTTGALRGGDVAPRSLELRRVPDGGRPGTVDRWWSWEGDRLRLGIADTDVHAAVVAHPDAAAPAEPEAVVDGWRVLGRRGRRARTSRLAERLRSMPGPGLGGALLGLDPGVRPTGGPPHPVQVIVGPDGARQRTIALAASELLGAGRTTLVVALDPGAVDRIALELADRAGEAGEIAPGRIVRAGLPTLAAVVASPVLGVDAAAAARGSHLLAALAALAAEARRAVVVAGAAPTRPDATDTTPRTVAPAGTDTTARTDATDATDGADATPLTAEQAEHRRAVALAEVAEADALLVAALVDSHAAATAHVAARDRARALDPARRAYRRVDTLVRSVEEASAAAAASAVGLARVVQDPGELAASLLGVADAATTRLDRRDRALAELDAALAAATATGRSRADVQAADRDVAAARDLHAAAERNALRARAVRSRAGAALAALAAPGRRAAPLPAPVAVAVAPAALQTPALVGIGGRPPAEPAAVGQLADDLARRREPEEVGPSLRDLREQHTAARNELAVVARTCLAEAPVVLTTLDELLDEEVLAGRRFDHVLIDGANALPPAAVVWLASLAVRSIVLADDLTGRPPPALASHPALDTPVLSLLGLETPAAVAAHPAGLVVEDADAGVVDGPVEDGP